MLILKLLGNISKTSRIALLNIKYEVTAAFLHPIKYVLRDF